MWTNNKQSLDWQSQSVSTTISVQDKLRTTLTSYSSTYYTNLIMSLLSSYQIIPWPQIEYCIPITGKLAAYSYSQLLLLTYHYKSLEPNSLYSARSHNTARSIAESSDQNQRLWGVLVTHRCSFRRTSRRWQVRSPGATPKCALL